jgi:hypothetical protein
MRLLALASVLLVGLAGAPASAKDFLKTNLRPEVIAINATAVAAQALAGPPPAQPIGDWRGESRGAETAVDPGCAVAGTNAVVKGLLAAAPADGAPRKTLRLTGPEVAPPLASNGSAGADDRATVTGVNLVCPGKVLSVDGR